MEQYYTSNKLTLQKVGNPRESTQNTAVELFILINISVILLKESIV